MPSLFDDTGLRQAFGGVVPEETPTFPAIVIPGDNETREAGTRLSRWLAGQIAALVSETDRENARVSLRTGSVLVTEIDATHLAVTTRGATWAVDKLAIAPPGWEGPRVLALGRQEPKRRMGLFR